MNKSILTMLFLILLIGNALAEEKADGYFWNRLDEYEKAHFFAGFLTGHRNGEYEGLIAGHFKGLAMAIDLIEGNMNIKVDGAVRQKMMIRMRNAIMNDEISISTYNAPGPLQAAHELDAFYKTYPLCKSRQLDLMLSEFIKVWSIEDKKTYKAIGEKCAEGN